MKLKYKNLRFGADALKVIEIANEIIADYQQQEFSLTLRQLYYQFVSRDLIPNADKEYDKLGSIIDRGRLAGLIDWEAIEDRTRIVRENSHWDSPSDIIDSAAASYKNDLWSSQKTRVQVWIEKDALVGVIEGICRQLDVACFSCRGYSSQSAMWRAAMRFRDYYRKHKQGTVILHLGDHDPSGVDMSRDIQDRLLLLSNNAPVEVKRIALTMAQVRMYNPPPNPAKITDSRATSYIEQYGNQSWELDALEPRTLVALVKNHVEALRDDRAYRKAYQKQEYDRRRLTAGAEQWDELDIKVEKEK
ncbi:MAG: hypothetical protein E4H01_17470 [Lysobacterales bacterium]|nr:MAG: hypothetical protein E4H01_17470 [Xanthomonadales bacterium]